MQAHLFRAGILQSDGVASKKKTSEISLTFGRVPDGRRARDAGDESLYPSRGDRPALHARSHSFASCS